MSSKHLPDVGTVNPRELPGDPDGFECGLGEILETVIRNRRAQYRAGEIVRIRKMAFGSNATYVFQRDGESRWHPIAQRHVRLFSDTQ